MHGRPHSGHRGPAIFPLFPGRSRHAMSEARTLLLVDGHNVAYRAFHALPPLTADDGTPTNAVLGFARILASLRDTWRPSHLCVAFDGGLPAARTEALAEYKAQRAPMPEPLRPQFDLIARYLALSGLASVRIEGEEADDVLATLARAAGAEADVLIVTGDKDLLQLVAPRIGIIRPQSPRDRVDAEGVRRILGVPPPQVPEWLALVGDTSDNIPGVPGVGPKTATALLDRFGSLAALWDRIGEVTPVRIRERLSAHREIVARNLSMTRLRDDLPGMPGWDAMVCGAPNVRNLRDFLERLGLRSLMGLVPEPELF